MQKADRANAYVAPEQELVKGLGLTSATTLVMGSMIGSGIFIVSAEIAREVSSPALLRATRVSSLTTSSIGATGSASEECAIP